MAITLGTLVLDTIVPKLRSLDVILDKAAAFAEAKGEHLVEARLVPDMFTLAMQVQTVCFFAQEIPRRLCGAGPSSDLGEPATSFLELKRRVAVALGAVRALADGSVDDADDRDCSLPMPDGRIAVMNGREYLLSFALPNFYFHFVAAYAILRKEGLAIGKPDYNSNIVDFLREKA